MGNVATNSVKTENGLKLAALYNQRKKSFIASQKQKDGETGGINSNTAKMSDAKKAKAKAKAKKAKKDRKRNK